MPFEIPDNIHPQCARLAWLLGTWAGNGHGEYPTIEPFQFGQEIIFQQDGRPFIHYLSRAWIVDEQGNHVREAAQETGFIRCLEDRTIEATEHAEEAVVSKEARVKEELVIRKEAEQRQQTVSDTVRHTEVEVEDERTAGTTATGGTMPTRPAGT